MDHVYFVADYHDFGELVDDCQDGIDIGRGMEGDCSDSLVRSHLCGKKTHSTVEHWAELYQAYVLFQDCNAASEAAVLEEEVAHLKVVAVEVDDTGSASVQVVEEARQHLPSLSQEVKSTADTHATCYHDNLL